MRSRYNKQERGIAFRDLHKQYNKIKDDFDAQIHTVTSTAHFIFVEQVKELEKELAAYTGAKYCIICGNGTDAISIVLMVAGIKEMCVRA